MVRSIPTCFGAGVLACLFLFHTTNLSKAGNPNGVTPYGFWGSSPAYGLGFPPSYFGYNLDDNIGGYYGGGRYREYYSYGRGYGVANYPGPLPGPGFPPDYRGSRRAPSYWEAVNSTNQLPAIVQQMVDRSITLVVEVPADADIWIDGRKTQQAGTTREYESPPLPAGNVYTYEIRAKWTEKGRGLEQTQIVMGRAGEKVSVNFPASMPLEKISLQPIPRERE
jgi:uncharacterized protein (TIGR03000 family)